MAVPIRSLSSGKQWVCPVFILALLTLGYSREAQGQTRTWTSEMPDSSGRATSLVADNDGNVHISYSDDRANVKYGFRSVTDGHWYTMTIGTTGAISTTIKVDSQGDPHICYTSRKLKYAFLDKKKWQTQDIGTDTSPAQFTCSLAISPDGTPHVAWYKDQNPDGSIFAHLRFARLQDGVWLVRTLDFDAQTGKWSSMTIGRDGNPYVSYDAFVKGDIKVAHWDGKAWHFQIIDSRGIGREGQYNIGMGNSIALDSQGLVHVSYFTESQLRYAHPKENGWAVETVERVNPLSGWASFRSSIALDRKGRPHICYEDAGVVKLASWDGSRWQIQLISERGQEQLRYSSITIDANDTIYVAYRDADDRSLKVAVGRLAATPQTAAAGPESKP